MISDRSCDNPNGVDLASIENGRRRCDSRNAKRRRDSLNTASTSVPLRVRRVCEWSRTASSSSWSIEQGTAVTNLSRILCAVDFSEPAHAAFKQALALGRARDAELALVIAAPANERLRARVRPRTAEIAAMRRACEAAGVRMSVQQGDPVEIILIHANSSGCDLIVLGTHTRTGFERLRSGSVAEQVTHRVACPVLVVPVPADGSDRHNTGSFANVLCPIDFSEVSTAALEQALRVVDQTRGRLTVMHVLPNLDPTSRYAYHLSA
jgi:nucleotide-binding universal stress UspA family protein